MKHAIWHIIPRISILILLIVLITTCAMAEQVAVMAISDDHMASSIDEQEATLRSAIEAYVYALKQKGDNAYVFATIRGKGEPVYIYTPESDTFDWETGDTGRNSDYFRRTLGQFLRAENTFDRLTVLTGVIQNAQNRNTDIIGENIPVMLYGTNPLPKNQTLIELFNNKLTMTSETNEYGITGYGNVMVKEDQSFQALTVLDDLLRNSYSGKIKQTEEGLGLPEVLASKSVLFVVGTNVQNTNIIVNSENIYSITSDPEKTGDKDWYSPLFSFGDKEMYIVSIPEGIKGNIKISGAQDAEAFIWFVKSDSFESQIAGKNFCPKGLEYNDDGTVTINLSEDESIQDMKLLYPELSFQASFTPTDASDPFTLYSEDNKSIHWENVINSETKVDISLRETKDGREVLPSLEYMYIPVSDYLDEIQAKVTITSKDEYKKREEVNIELILDPETIAAEGKERVLKWLDQSTASIIGQNDDDSSQEMMYDPQTYTFSRTTQLPTNAGEYTWGVILASGRKSPLAWSKTYQSESINIKNNDPVLNSDKIPETNLMKMMQPGGNVTITIPKGLFADPDSDMLTISYTIYKESEEISQGTFEGKEGISPEYDIKEINDFGDWKIELVAADNDGAKSEPIILNIHVENGNTAPYINVDLAPDQEQRIPLLRLSDYTLRIPRGLFVDDEKDIVNISGSLSNERGDYTQISIDGEEGASGSWETQLEQFGTYTVTLEAVDSFGEKSPALSFKIALIDALNALPGTLQTEPEIPQKGDKIRIQLFLEWPEEYASLNLRDWLENCTATVIDDKEQRYDMRLSSSSLMLETAEIQMPDQKTSMTYTAVITANEGNEPQKRFSDYQPLTISIDNSAPKVTREALDSQTKFCFELDEFTLKIPEDLFEDSEGDDYTVSVAFVDGNNETRAEQTFSKGEAPEIKLPDFGKWTIRLTAKDSEGLTSEPFDYCTITLNNLKQIVIIAGAGLLLVIGIILAILIARHKKNLPRFHQSDAIVFTQNKQPVSEYIHMPENNNQQAVPLSTFAVAISILLSDTQWNNLKQWSICPTKDETPIFRKSGSKNGGEHKIDLGEDLYVEITNEQKHRGRFPKDV